MLLCFKIVSYVFEHLPSKRTLVWLNKELPSTRIASVMKPFLFLMKVTELRVTWMWYVALCHKEPAKGKKFDLKPLNTSKRALNTNPPFFWDTLYVEGYLAMICREVVRLLLLLTTVKFVLEQSQLSGLSDRNRWVWREQKYPDRRRPKSGLACGLSFHGKL